MRSFSIKDLSELTGVKQHTIRAWEQRYSFLLPARSATQQRVYTVEELNTVLNVSLLNQQGFKLAKINKMSLEEKVALVARVVDQQQKAVNKLIIEMARMDATAFEMILDNCIHSWGVHETIEGVMIPFAWKLQLWHSGFNKNYVENTVVIRGSIREKLHLAIDKAHYSEGKNHTLVLFQTGASEGELVLLYLQYKLKMMGFTVVNPGFVPMDHLALVCEYIKPCYVVSFAGKKQDKEALRAMINKQVRLSPKTEVMLLGNQDLEYSGEKIELKTFLSQPLLLILSQLGRDQADKAAI